MVVSIGGGVQGARWLRVVDWGQGLSGWSRCSGMVRSGQGGCCGQEFAGKGQELL